MFGGSRRVQAAHIELAVPPELHASLARDGIADIEELLPTLLAAVVSAALGPNRGLVEVSVTA